MGRLSPCPHLNAETGAVGSLRPRLPRPCRRSTKSLGFGFGLARQLLVRNAPSDSLGERLSESAAVIVLALVEAKSLLIEIAKQMKGLDADVGSFQAALQQRPEILDPVRVDIAIDVAFRVVDHLMHVIGIQSVVGAPCIAENVGAALDIFADESLKGRGAGIGDVPQANLFGFAIQQSHDDGLAATGPASARDLGFLVLVHEASRAADERFVNLEVANRFLERAVLHRLADAMQHEPRGLLSDPQIAGDLAGANSVLAIRDQPDRREPFIESDRRILEDGPDLCAELLEGMLGSALPDAPRGQKDHVHAAAGRAGDLAVRPAHRNRRAQAVVGIREICNRFVKRGRDIRVHDQRIAHDGR